MRCDLYSACVCRCQVAALPRCIACACLLAHAALAFARARREAACCAQSMEGGGITTASAARVCAGGDGEDRKSSVSMTIDRGLNVLEPLSCIVLKPFSVWLHNRPQQFFGVTTHLNRVNSFKRTTGNLCLCYEKQFRGDGSYRNGFKRRRRRRKCRRLVS